MLNKEQNFFTVKDVAAAQFIREYADHLKKANKLKVPAWTEWTQTSTANELAPTDPDWVYLRVAAVARKIYLKPHTGVSTLRHIFGSVKRRGCLRNVHEHCHGKLVRWSLQQLEELKILRKDKTSALKKFSRVITKEGMTELNRIATQIALKNREKQQLQ
ncbi:hypothetical protein IMG5_118010 [Ichthyophthirius multifiliis]|uniref:40S ribosomal protein S19 n=1 Tax=Ichthyophthirius multifiliis TaxID=5932 RepID=G0QUN0_ICHMU|nr:hypothetical protein IMG5_118010 [Ichthyophthirius multifiliis]EGR31076.1 hypothetical protein IMG5_118010 [Ichthyophthirius multifiliis]|eukprot:XP_004034562.1 hypothetical protein IMG5_118010 [Ichthyophthirius multifiliis]